MAQVMGRHIADHIKKNRDNGDAMDLMTFTGKIFSHDAFEAARLVLMEALGEEEISVKAHC